MAKLAEMEAFAAIAEAGSISKAAARLGLAKSAVSRRLADLEARLGVQLVSRTTRRLSLTEAGRDFYQRTARLLSDLDEAELSASARGRDLKGGLRIAAPQTFGIMHLAPLVTAFSVKHPGVTVDIDFNDRRVDLVEEGFDVAVRIGRLEDSSLIARRLAPVRSVVCASPAFWDIHGRPASPEALAGLPALLYGLAPAGEKWRWTDDDGRPREIAVRPRMTSNSGEFLAHAAEAGFGVIRVPIFIVHDQISKGTLEPALIDCSWGELGLFAIYPPTRHLSARVRAFVDHLAASIGDHPYWDDCLDAL